MLRRLVRAGAGKDERLAARALFIPKNARPVLEHTNGSALYTYEENGRLYAISFWGTSARPMDHYRYSTEEKRNEAILRFKSSVEASVDRKAKARAEKAAWTNPLKVGDILYTSWGYDQTNIDFYVVTKVSGRKTTVAKIAQDSESIGFMQDRCWPAMPIRIVGKESAHIAQPSGISGVYVNIDGHYAWLEQGRSHYSSSYA